MARRARRPAPRARTRPRARRGLRQRQERAPPCAPGLRGRCPRCLRYAIERLRTAAGERELPIEARVIDVEREPLPKATYAVVACFNYLQRDLFPALEAALEQSGLLVYETFVQPQTSMNPAYVLEAGELRTAFPALTVLDYREENGVAGLVARSATNSS